LPDHVAPSAMTMRKCAAMQRAWFATSTALGLALLMFACALMFTAPSFATEKKTIRIAFRSAESGFDPAKIEDRYSVGIVENIFEALLTYDWLARPVKLAPQLVERVPEAEEGGTRYTFRIKPGIYFADDPAFKGKKRELTAMDVEYSIKRFRDPEIRSPYSWLFEDKLVGLDEYVERITKANQKFSYEEPIAGIQVRDRYTISFKLKAADYNFIYFFAMPNVGIVAREVIETYADDTMAHPVGTGAYVLKEWVRRSRVVLERNPNYRGHTLDTTYASANDVWDQEAIKALAGKTLPLIDRVEIYPIEEEQPRYLAFVGREHDLLEEVPFSFIPQLMPNGELVSSMKARNVRVFPELQPEIVWDGFNMEDPVVGGYTPEKVALRRAMILGHDRAQEIRVVRRGQAIPMHSLAGPGVVGFDETFRSREIEYDPARAKALLDLYGYKDRDGDGYRELPDGKPLSIRYIYRSFEQSSREQAELWVKCMAAIGIRMDTSSMQFVDLLKERKAGKYQMSGFAWIADYPDAQNFLQLLYGPNTDISNDSRFKLPEYDRLYAQALTLPDSPERNRLYREMTKLAVVYAPWRFVLHRQFVHVLNPWVKGYKKHPILYTSFRYLDIDSVEQRKAIR
jgi:oligopeptide transport system substrate-binding protein